MNYLSFFFLPLLLLVRHLFTTADRRVLKWVREPADYDDEALKRMATVTSHDQYLFNRTLDEILIERVPDTPSHAKVKSFISGAMSELGWNVTLQEFDTQTVIGKKKFSNIIATHNPKACRRLVLACHYDSKLTSGRHFVGATDSAVPCAMMISMAYSLKKALDDAKDTRDLGLQFLFFDGEEAFKDWSATDSLYGSRHLAKTWDRKLLDEESSLCPGGSIQNENDRIELFVLLDLIGGKNPTFYSYFAQTYSVYKWLVEIEQSLGRLGLFESKTRTYFVKQVYLASIEDDHIPFMKRDVPILHIIPNPFPAVWHMTTDDRSHLHDPSINNLLKIFRVFISKYLNLKLV